MKSSGVVAAVAVAGLLAAFTAATLAQPYPTAAPPHQPTSASPPAQEAGGNEPSEQSGISAPVLRISSVEIVRTAHAPVLDIVRVRAFASSSGWEEGELVPLTRGVPADGMLHLVFIARAPSVAVDAGGFETIEAIFPLETDHPFKGVNVHSATDSVTVTSLPGYSEGKPAGEDCRKCVGKIFVARGASGPSGRAAAELIREEQLPPITRVIGPADGIPTADSNPNRLTLILNKEGRITTAVWE
jgi:hypothetical protein